MPEVTLDVELGRTVGSAASRRLRAEGRIPAVIYGHGIEPTALSVDGRELRHALSGDAGTNQLLAIKVGGTSHLALAREMQRHPVRRTVSHVDFQVVRRDEIVAASVPVVLVGEAKEVERERGLVEHVVNLLRINAVPSAIPTSIEVDISDLVVGSSIRVGDLPLPQGVTTDLDAEEVVVLASASRTEADVEAAGAEGAEAAAGAEESTPSPEE